MAIVAGDRITLFRLTSTSSDPLSFPRIYPLFGTVYSVGLFVLWDNGVQAGVSASALQKLAYLAPVYKRVRLAGVPTPEYTGIVVGHYNRESDSGTTTGPWYLIKLLSGVGYMEVLVSDTEEVAGS
jgi:hypothetical protein